MSVARPGETLGGRYELVAELARTPSGVWYRARDHEARVEVALWAVSPAIAPAGRAHDRLMNAIAAMRGVVHPRLLRLFDVSRAGDLLYVTAELHEPARLPNDAQVPRELWHVAEALDAVHAAGQVHGRLTPVDIVVSAGEVRVAGAGLFVDIDSALAASAWGELVRFWAPEVVRGSRPTPWADVYSLAALCAELMAGVSDPARAMADLSERRRSVHAVLERALLPVPEMRPSSPAMLMIELRAALDQEVELVQAARTVIDSVPESVMRVVAVDEDRTERSSAPPVEVAAAAGSIAAGRALPFVSMKPPSEPSAARTPVIPAIERPEMQPRIRAITQPGAHAHARPASLGHYAPPRDEDEARRRRVRIVVSVAVVSAIIALIIVLALMGHDVPAQGTP